MSGRKRGIYILEHGEDKMITDRYGNGFLPYHDALVCKEEGLFIGRIGLPSPDTRQKTINEVIYELENGDKANSIDGLRALEVKAHNGTVDLGYLESPLQTACEKLDVILKGR